MSGVPENLIEEMRRLYRGLEMSAGIMRDPARTGRWAGAEKTAAAFSRYAATAQSLHSLLVASAKAESATPSQRLDAATVERCAQVTPALHEGGRFLEWSSVDLAAQCLSQAREQLDPEFSQFMTAVAARLSVQRAAPKMDRVAVAQIIDPTAWRNIDGYAVEQVHSGDALAKADAVLRLIALATEPHQHGGKA